MITIRDGISDRDEMIFRRHGLFSVDGMISGTGGMISVRN
jgi:hypothetical protein